MASTQKTKTPVSDARKASMKAYYESKKQQINKNRLLNRIKSGKQKGLQRAKLELYDWTDEEYAFLEDLVNEKVVKKTTTAKPRRVVTQQEEEESVDTEQTVFTKDEFESALLADTKAVTDGSKTQWRIVYRNYKRLFDFNDENFTDFLNVFTDDEIEEILRTAYPNPKTLIKQMQFIPKLYNILGDPFQKFLTDARYKIWDRKQNQVSQEVKAGNNTRKEQTGIDHVPAFVNMFKNELQLRSKSPGTVQHALAVMYTIGVYKDLSKLNDPTFIPRLDYDDVRLVDDESQIDLTAKAKWYNLKTGRLLINDLKTDRFYTYDYNLNNTAKRQIDLYLTKTKKKVGEKLFNLSTKKMPEAVKKSIGIGNRQYRKMFQNVYHKVFKVKIEQMSNPMGHDVDTAINTYMDSYTYTESERATALAAIKTQVALNSK
jgi:hypothetical protein